MLQPSTPTDFGITFRPQIGPEEVAPIPADVVTVFGKHAKSLAGVTEIAYANNSVGIHKAPGHVFDINIGAIASATGDGINVTNARITPVSQQIAADLSTPDRPYIVESGHSMAKGSYVSIRPKLILSAA